MSQIDYRQFPLLADFEDEDPTEHELVHQLAAEAQDFLRIFTWCRSVIECRVGIALGQVVGAFLVKIEPDRQEIAEWHWIIVGDLPPAYIVTEAAPDGVEAVERYIEEMSAWVEAVEAGESVQALIPVTARGGRTPIAPTPPNAAMLRTRLQALRELILPEFR